MYKYKGSDQMQAKTQVKEPKTRQFFSKRPSLVPFQLNSLKRDKIRFLHEFYGFLNVSFCASLTQFHFRLWLTGVDDSWLGNQFGSNVSLG